MLWPSLVVVASAVVFLYLEARRSRLTFCGRRPSEALTNSEKSQLKPTTTTPQQAAKTAKHQPETVGDAAETSKGVTSDVRAARQRDGRCYLTGGADRINGQVRN